MTFLCGHVGDPSGTRDWIVAVRAHAEWLGHVALIAESVLPDGRHAALATLSPRRCGNGSAPRWTGGALVVGPRMDGESAPGNNWASVSLDLRSGELSMQIPLASPQQLYYRRRGGGIQVADDLRLFPRLDQVRLDQHGIYALLAYGSVPAPLTIWQGVRRVPGGHRLVLAGDPTAPERLAPLGDALPDALASPPPDPDGLVAEALEAILEAVPEETTLFYSGGVDSSLLAARLVRRGRRDVRAVNYRFSEADPESRHALRLAAHLGVPVEVVTHDPDSIGAVLERLARDYSYPFADLSTIATNDLVHRALSSARAVDAVLEGTGADGAFGLGNHYPRWRRTYSLPAALRLPLGTMYPALGLWRRRSQAERIGRFLRKSGRRPLAQAVVAQNALDGIAYHAPLESRAAVAQAVGGSLVSLSGGALTLEELSVMDVAWVCAGRMAPKSCDPLRQAGVRPIYPFLEPRLLGVSRSIPGAQRCPGGEAKAILKRLLAAQVPRELVYRPKSGFTPPYREMFAGAPLQAFLHDVVLAPDNPVLDFCVRPVLRTMVDRCGNGSSLPGSVHDFLWSVAFASGWLAQQRHP